ncbi:hypothetical protein A9Q99_18505 [Gammaproteobacteria bacterium 45_16_T64]|nr:hypothetical protein A9Q99_18505 [Gammaproteobacteria bacterium 45_16_T64]
MKFIAAVLLSLFIVACQMPGEHRVVSDNSAGISFSIPESGEGRSYQVFVDGLPMGDAHGFAKNKNILKIISGTHMIRVERDGVEVMKEKIYVSSGTNKVLVIPQ